MLKQFLILILLIFWALVNAPALRGQTLDEIVSSSAQLAENQEAFDNRSLVLEKYLAQFNSPLAPFANEFIEAADAYGLDWRLLPAITGVESTYGKFIPKNSYNAYGWANGAYSFQSWPDSIWHVSQALKEKYIEKGANTVEKIGRIYAPPSPFWAGKVKKLMVNIDSKPQFTLDL